MSTDNGVLPPAQQTAPPPAAPGGAPSTNGGNGRDGRGRFTAGNRGGPGNPFARQTAALRRALLAVVTPQDIEAIARMLVERARGGDLVAVKLLLLYAVGRPAEAVDPDTLDVQEWHLFQQLQASAEQVQTALGGLPIEAACATVRAARGPLADAATALLVQGLKQPPIGPQAAAHQEAPATVTAGEISQEAQTRQPASITGRQAARGSEEAPPRNNPREGAAVREAFGAADLARTREKRKGGCGAHNRTHSPDHLPRPAGSQLPVDRPGASPELNLLDPGPGAGYTETVAPS
jgi:hypothetical protein